MKRKFEFPQIMDMELADTAAGLFSSNSDDTPPQQQDDSWTITTRYCNHNSGSHSEVEIKMVYSGGKEGYDTVSMKMEMINGFKLDYVKDSSGKFVSGVSETGFVISDTFHHNATEQVVFNIQIVVKNGPVHNGHIGAAHVTGDVVPCDCVCVHYTIA